MPALVMPRAPVEWSLAPLVIAEADDAVGAACEPAVADCTPESSDF